MKKTLNIGIAGCGAIGSSLARIVAQDFRGKAALSGLFDIRGERSAALAEKLGEPRLAAASLSVLIARSDLVIESASSRVSASIARACLSKGKSVMLMSVGGLLPDKLPVLEKLCRRTGARMYIPSGAISGVDALKAAKLSGIKSVTLTTTKHPRSFEGVEYVCRRGIRLGEIRKPSVLFSGSAAEAVRFFPQNINVAAVLSIAGIGALKTRVRIIASPLATKNIHEIIVESGSARIVTRTENNQHPENPKTSYLAVLSAAALLAQIVEPVRIGT